MKNTALILILILANNAAAAGDTLIKIDNPGGLCYRLDYQNTYCNNDTMIVNGSSDHFIDMVSGTNTPQALNASTGEYIMEIMIVSPFQILEGLLVFFGILVSLVIFIVVGITFFISIIGVGQRNG